MDIKGIIFDCDGTLADTMPPHYEAWVTTLDSYGLALEEDRFYAMGGWPTAKVAEVIIGESGQALDAQSMGDTKEATFERSLHLVEPIGPVVDIVREHVGKLPLAVATGGTRSICERILKHIGLFDCFDAIVTADDVEHHKPAPDVFLEAARRLGVEPAHCRVYEDTDPGVEAARRAGMECVDVRTFYSPRRVSGNGR